MNRIKQLREQNKMNQSELASFLGVSQGTLSNWERGTHEPDSKSLIMLAQKFNVTVDYILGQKPQAASLYNAQNIKNSNLVQGSGNLLNGSNENDVLSVDESELLRIYRVLNAKQRHKLMSLVFDMEEHVIKDEVI